MKNLLLLIGIVGLSHQALAQLSVLQVIDTINRAGSAWWYGRNNSNNSTSAPAQCDTGSKTYIDYAFKDSYRSADKRGINCTAYFQKESGQFGSKGLKIQALLYKYPVFLQAKPSADMPSVCPKFSGFSEDQKIHFWVWFWTALSLDESSCGSDTRNVAAVNGTAVGDFQMEVDPELRKIRPPVCRTGNMLKFDKNAACAIAVMDVQLRNKKKLFYSPNYWNKLNSASGKVFNLIRKYPGCN